MRTVLVIAALLLAGCGQRGEPGKEAAPAAVVAALAKEQKRDDRPAIVAFGDSLSAGDGLEAGESYPDFLQKKLDEQGYRYRVVNQG
jgi:acyl-CoA thioesterase-1